MINGKNKLFGVLALFLIGIMALSTVSLAFSEQNIEYLKINGEMVDPNGDTKLKVERGSDVDVKVKLVAPDNENLSNMEINARVVGYEYGDRQSLSDTTHVFDLENGETDYKELSISLPDRMEKDTYDLRITMADRAGVGYEETYELHLKGARHGLKIKDVIIAPENGLKTGGSLLAMVRVQNIGEKDEEGVKIKVSIPELGIAASDYIDELEAGESTTSEELFLRVPKCATPGKYTAIATIEYDEGFEKVVEEVDVIVLDGDVCVVTGKTDEKTIITVGPESQDVVAGQGGVIYPLTISNSGSATKTYTVSANAGDWASVKISPTNVVVLDGGEAKAVYVYVSAKEDAAPGEHLFALSVKSGDKTLKEIALKANVVGDESASAGWDKVKKGLEVGLIVLVVLLVILGLIIGFNKLKEDDEEPKDDSGQTYY